MILLCQGQNDAKGNPGLPCCWWKLDQQVLLAIDLLLNALALAFEGCNSGHSLLVLVHPTVEGLHLHIDLVHNFFNCLSVFIDRLFTKQLFQLLKCSLLTVGELLDVAVFQILKERFLYSIGGQ